MLKNTDLAAYSAPPPGRGHELSAMSSNTKGGNYLLEIPGATAVCFLIVDLARDHRDACTYVELVSCHLYKGMSLSSNIPYDPVTTVLLKFRVPIFTCSQ